MSSKRSKKQKIEIGDCVETSKGEKCIIRYIGKVEGLSNHTLYGIEYIDGTMGEHNGKYKGKKYFIGLPKRCSFIKYDKIRRKTKYYNNMKSQSKSKKHRNTKTHSKYRRRNVHSNDIFSRQYMRSISVSPSPNPKKRRSLPIKLNKSNQIRKKRSRNATNVSRRCSSSTKTLKNKRLPNIEQLTKSHKRYKTKKRSSTISAGSVKKASDTNSTNINCIRSKSIGSKHKNTCRKKRKKNKECSLYKYERIRFSVMNALKLNDDHGLHMREDKRKNAFSNIILSDDCLNEYYLKRNIMTGEIIVGHRYVLKNGNYGICLYVGAVHWINYGKLSVENEYIGIALEEGNGKHDGEWRGKRYFQCKSRCGIFVTRNELWKDCGAVEQHVIDEIIKKHKRKIGGLLYESESDISDLSDLINNLSDDTSTHSGHSDFGDDNICDDFKDIDDEDIDDVLSYIDLFSPSVDEEYDENIKLKPKLTRSASDKYNCNVASKTVKKSNSKKSSGVSLNNLIPLELEVDAMQIKCTKRYQSQTPNITKRTKKLQYTNTKQKKTGNRMQYNNDETVLNLDEIDEILKGYNDKSISTSNDIRYEAVSTKRRSRRHATPNVSLPILIGADKFKTLFNDVHCKNNDIEFLKSLTPLTSDQI